MKVSVHKPKASEHYGALGEMSDEKNNG